MRGALPRAAEKLGVSRFFSFNDRLPVPMIGTIHTFFRPFRYGGILLTAAFIIQCGIPDLQAIERRRPQFSYEQGHLFFPLPYSLPGIGQGVFYIVGVGNILDTTIDAYGLIATGDAAGTIMGVGELPILPETLLFDYQGQNISKALVAVYRYRGMNTGADDYNLLEIDSAKSQRAGLTLTFWERRLEFKLGMGEDSTHATKLRNPDGEVLYTFEGTAPDESEFSSMSISLDYTDDLQDPREGIRLTVGRTNSPPADNSSPDYYTENRSIAVYHSAGKQSVMAFYFLQSDAVVSRTGLTDPELVKDALSLTCSSYDSCSAEEKSLIDNRIAANRNGTSTSLGGSERLRSYPGGRFQGAHTRFYAAEFRWNITEEFTPFNYYIWKDVRTSFQIAFFYEMGSVGETRGEVGDSWRYSRGVGFRMVSASGIVYRADFATGDEGAETSIIFSYPF